MNIEDVVTVTGSIQIPAQVQEHLKKGPSYAFKEIGEIQNTIPKFERLVRNLDKTSRERERWKYVEEFKTYKNKNTENLKAVNREKHALQEAQKWIRSNSIMITREDKSKKIVLMEKR